MTRVGFVLFDGGTLFETAGPLAVFERATDQRDSPLFDVVLCSPSPAPLRTTSGLSIAGTDGVDALEGSDIVVVPTWPRPGESVPAEVTDALRAAHEAGAIVVGLCLGAFVLAASGLLDHRPATTHWHRLDELADLHPGVRVERDRLYVDDGDVVTSAGSAAGIDCCLHLVRRTHGAVVASTTARRMVVAPHRDGGQAQYVPVAEPAADAVGVDALDTALAWAAAHLERRLGVGELASKAHMSRRTFERRMQERTGESPQQWLLHQRVLRAAHLLETTDLPVERVAHAAGLGSATVLRTHFRHRLGVSPTDYRRRFGRR